MAQLSLFFLVIVLLSSCESKLDHDMHHVHLKDVGSQEAVQEQNR